MFLEVRSFTNGLWLFGHPVCLSWLSKEERHHFPFRAEVVRGTFRASIFHMQSAFMVRSSCRNTKITALWGYYTPNLELTMFCAPTPNNQQFLHLQQIVQVTQKWHWNLSRPSGFQVMDQNIQNIVMINNSKTARPT